MSVKQTASLSRVAQFLFAGVLGLTLDERYLQLYGKPVCMTLNGKAYSYERNMQGDITGLLDSNNNEVVTYTYDSWGKLLNIGGSLADTVGKENPLRYRGYYYDTETGLFCVVTAGV